MNTQNTDQTARQGRFSRTAFAAGGVMAAAVVVAGTMTSASAARPAVDGPAQVTADAGTATSPCFAVRTADRWARDVGDQPRCTHPYGSTTEAFAAAVAERPGPQYREVRNGATQPSADSPCFMNPEQWNVTFDGGTPVCSAR